jgi:formylglycine-generating enzyme required for sulfatase activity
MKNIVMTIVSAGIVAASAAPSVDEVEFSFSASTGKAEVTYTLSGGPAIVTFDVLTNGVSIGASEYAGAWGDVWKQVANGSRSFFWRPQGSLGGRALTKDDGTLMVKVKAWPLDDPPNWLVTSLSTQSNVFYYTEAALVPGGVQADRYRSDWLVMRRIPAAGVTWRMGLPHTSTLNRNRDYTHAVTLSRDYYMAIYAMTCEQTVHLSSQDVNNLADDTKPYRPSVSFKWTDCRGKNWPSDGHDVTETSLFGLLRARTGLELDYPTDAQWEYACRAGTGSTWNNGAETIPEGLDLLGWYNVNVGSAAALYKDSSQKVGLLDSNAWGLYDMHGNNWEFTLDWNIDDLRNEPELDPKGAQATSGAKVIRGGVYFQSAGYLTSYHRNNQSSGSSAAIRLVCPVAMPDLVTGR